MKIVLEDTGKELFGDSIESIRKENFPNAQTVMLGGEQRYGLWSQWGRPSIGFVVAKK